jgi:hypothetical protein
VDEGSLHSSFDATNQTVSGTIPPETTEVVIEVPPARIADVPPAPSDQIPPALPAIDDSGQPKRRGPKRIVVLVGAVVVVALIAAVAAVALSGGGTTTAKKTSDQPSRTSPIPTLPLLAPVELSAKAAPFSVTLTWTQPTGGAEVIGYKVYRDGLMVGSVSSPSTTFEDSNVLPGASYTYGVLSRGAGVDESDPTSVQLTTPVPALSAARVSGNFDVRVKPTYQFGYSETFRSGTAGWNFEPKCSEGACSTVWRDINLDSIKFTLARKGVTYAGSGRGKFDITCGGVDQASKVTVQLKVVKATVIDGQWRAVRLTGKLTQREGAALGCRSSGADYRITANLVD